MNDAERRAALADFLYTRRRRLDPEELGLPLWGRRRTSGLRREEVAALAEIGVTWYTWLEQGRKISVSKELLERLSQALGLNPDERPHLFTLAGHPLVPLESRAVFQVESVLQAFLNTLDLCPAHIRNARWDVLAWNRAEALITDWQTVPPAERNVLLNHFGNPRMRQLLPEWERDGQMLVALFRMEYARYTDVPAFVELVQQLQKSSEEFRSWWSQHDVKRQRMEPMELLLPEVGHLVLDRLTVIVQQEPLLTLRALLPPAGTDNQQKLQHVTKDLTRA